MQVEISEKTRESTQKQWSTIRELLDSYLIKEGNARTLLLRRSDDFSEKSFGASSTARKEVLTNVRRILTASGVTDNRDTILRHPNGIHGLRDLFIMVTEALDPREAEIQRIASSNEPTSVRPGHKDMARWPKEQSIEQAVLQPRGQNPIQWDNVRDSVENRETGMYSVITGTAEDEAPECLSGEQVWDPSNRGPITRVAIEQEDGTFRVLLDLEDTEAWPITRYMEEARDILRLQAPEAPVVWQAAWNSSGVDTSGRSGIRKRGEETPLSGKPQFAVVRAEIIGAEISRDKRAEHASQEDRSASTDIDSDVEMTRPDSICGSQAPATPASQRINRVSANKRTTRTPKRQVLGGEASGKRTQLPIDSVNRDKEVPPRISLEDIVQEHIRDQQEARRMAGEGRSQHETSSLPLSETQPNQRLVLAAIDFECSYTGSSRQGTPAIPVEGGIVMIDVDSSEVVGHGHGMFYQDMPLNRVEQSRHTSWAVTGLPPATFVDIATGRPPRDLEQHVHTFQAWGDRLATELKAYERREGCRVHLFAKGKYMEMFLLTDAANGLAAESRDYFAQRLVDENELPTLLVRARPDLEQRFRVNYNNAQSMEWLDLWTSRWQSREAPKRVCPYHSHTAGCYHCALADSTLFAIRVLALFRGTNGIGELEDALRLLQPAIEEEVRAARESSDIVAGLGFQPRHTAFQEFGPHPAFREIRDGHQGNRFLVVPDREHRFGIGFGFAEVAMGMKGLLLSPDAFTDRDNRVTRNPIWTLEEELDNPEQLRAVQGRAGLGAHNEENMVTLSQLVNWWPSRERIARQETWGCEELAEALREFEGRIANVKAPRTPEPPSESHSSPETGD
ncbi:hypothetical protein J8273_7573 [Carpediemonas membranifera]|uniref:Uncharacterized protein n=1 Tax=Carpediemonas membranifera TaxID=201153 RepID=A0A8J6E831_9EUKA|nr:hypothetical protein J8273_7573 [Carpediemonas membranifera]|eukprot:KAG9391360.1 hypothetical protein J8273_7573 [Carpediemonas membranifera]